MPDFVEELATQQLWYWLETQRDWTVDGEVSTTNGRIDLAAETPDGRFVGVELKAAVNLQFGSTLPEQVQRYIDCEQFDEIYYAGPSVSGVTDAVTEDTSDPVLPVIREACKSLAVGVREGRYDEKEVLDEIEREVPEEILSHEYRYDDREVREYIELKITNSAAQTSQSISINDAVRQIEHSVFPEELGVIEVPLPLQGGYLRSPRMALTPGEIHDPEVIKEPDAVERTGEPDFNRNGEPWVRHCVWREFGGIPEGHIPNIMETEVQDRPIDVLAFSDEWDPAKILDGDEEGDIIGIEAKGESGVSSSRTLRQLREFLEPNVLTRLYLAVPRSAREDAEQLIENEAELNGNIGILTVDEAGVVETIREAPELDLQHDGYLRRGESFKTGYAEVRIPNGKDIQDPFDLGEWRDPLRDDQNRPVIWENDPREYVDSVSSPKQLSLANPTETREELKQYVKNGDKIRAYLLKGLCAAPYADGKKHRRDPKNGFTRFTITEFETNNGEYGLDLHFGGGSWKGGYVCLIGDQIEDLVTILASIDKLARVTINGQGRVIDLETFDFSYGENYEHRLTGEDAQPEQLLPLTISAVTTQDGIGAKLQLGEGPKRGVDMLMTQTQRLDLLRTIRVTRFGRPSEIPGDGSYERVGPDGKDTWDRGTSVEKRHNPNRVEELDRFF